MTEINKLAMGLDEIIALEKAKNKKSKKVPPPKADKGKYKPKQSTAPANRPNGPRSDLASANRSKSARFDSAPKGQWRHDRYGADDSVKPYKQPGKGHSAPGFQNGKAQGLVTGNLSNRVGPLLSQSARSAMQKSGPITTAQLRANTNSHTPPEHKPRPKAIPERAPAPAPKHAAPKPAPSIAIKGASGPATVLVSNLDPEANTADLREYFGQFGEVIEVSLLYDAQSRCSGNAEIKYRKKADAQEAVKMMHNVVADERIISVQLKPDSAPPARTVISSAPRQENRALPASSRGSTGPVRNTTRAPANDKPYSRPNQRDSRR